MKAAQAVIANLLGISLSFQLVTLTAFSADASRGGADHWAFDPLSELSPPEGRTDWSDSVIDRYLADNWQAVGIEPAEGADRRMLLRRVYFALTGLPPTIEQAREFLEDAEPDAFARLVDRLLASPRFGERWGRHWLDVARYAESSGGGRSLLLPTAWRYRDYVIDAFNSDKPFDEFAREQIAGDLLPYDSVEQGREQLTAAAFLALGPTNYELQDKTQLEMDVIDEQIDVIGQAFMGLTLGCARCHDHKFDPIPTRDYYAMAGILGSTQTLLHDNVSSWVKRPLPITSRERINRMREFDEANERILRLTRMQKQIDAIRLRLGQFTLDDQQAETIGSWQSSRSVAGFQGKDYRYTNDPKARAVYTWDVPRGDQYEIILHYTSHPNRSKRVEVTVQHAEGSATVAVNQRNPRLPAAATKNLGAFTLSDTARVEIRPGSDGATVIDGLSIRPIHQHTGDHELATSQLAKLEERVKRLEAAETRLQPIERVMAVRDEPLPADLEIRIRGDAHQLGEVVPRGFLSLIQDMHSPQVARQASGRLALADWIVSEENPLTARVVANRVWHHLFGRGIVRTVDNFGHMGEQPVDKRLLDYLAFRLKEHDWRLKPLIREIVLSKAWQLDSRPSASAQELDPDNRLFAWQRIRRLDAESLHDAMLLLSGELQLDDASPTQQAIIHSEYGYEFSFGPRAVYLPVLRNKTPEILAAFDFPNANLSEGARTSSTLATQALFIMNSPFVSKRVERATDRLLSRDSCDNKSDVQCLFTLYERALGRPPTQNEQRIAIQFLANGSDQKIDRVLAWRAIVQSIMASYDFRYIR